MDITKALQNLLEGKVTQDEIELLKQALALGEISIGGNVIDSVIIHGSGNTVQVVQLTPETSEIIGAEVFLGGLKRNLNGDEIALGLQRLEAELILRAPVLTAKFQDHARRLRPTLKTNPNSLSESARTERIEALARINSLCMEALDISFNAVATGEKLPEYEYRCPFRGLESFRVEDHEFFFGREELTQDLVRRIRAYPFLAVLGASGSGKSSLVMAGMIPALDSDYIIFRPGANPLRELESARGKSLIVVDQFEELFTLTRDEETRADFISALLDSTRSARVIITLRSDFLSEAGAYRSLSAEIQNHLEIVPPMKADELRRAVEGQARWARLEFEADLSQQILDNVVGEPGAMPLLQHALWELWNRRHGRHLRANEYREFGGVKQAIALTAEKVHGDCSKAEQEQLRDIFLRLTRLDEGDEGRDTRRRVPLGDLIPSGASVTSISSLLNKLAKARLIVMTVTENSTEIEVAHEALVRHWERLRIWLNEDRDNLHLRESVSEAAKEWEKSGKHESLLNSRWVKLDEALLLAQNSRYRLTEIEQAYLMACVALRNKEQRGREQRLRYTVFASFAAAIIFLALGSFGWVKNNEAASQAATAQARAEELKNLAIVEQANKAIKDHNMGLGLALAINAAEMNNPSSKTYSTLLDAAYVNLSQKMFDVCVQSSLEKAWVTALDISPDDAVAAVGCSAGSESNIRLLDLKTGKVNGEWVYPAWIYSLAYAPDGQTIFAGYSDSNAIMWNLDGSKKFVIEEHDAAVSAVEFGPDGTLVATASHDKTVATWESSTGRKVERIIGSTTANFPGKLTSLDFSPGGQKIVIGDDEGNIFIWDWDKDLLYSDPVDKHDKFVLHVSFGTDDFSIYSGSADSTIKVWTQHEYLELKTKLDLTGTYPGVWVRNIVFTPDKSKFLTPLSNGMILLWDAASLQVIQHLEGHLGEVENLVVSSDGAFALSGSRDGTVRQWDLAAMEPKELIDVSQHMGMNPEINSFAITKDSSFLVGGTANGRISVWDLTGKSMLTGWTVFSADTAISEIKLSPDEKFVLAADNNGEVVYSSIWDRNQHFLWDFPRQGDNALSVDISPDGKQGLVGYLSGKIILLDMETGKPVCELDGHTNSVNSVRFTVDGGSAVSGSNDYNVSLWNLSSCKMDRVLYSHDGWVMSLSPSKDGKLLASTSADGSTIIWNFASNQIVHRLHVPDGDMNSGLDGMGLSLDFSPDGNLLAAGAANGGLAVWSVANGNLLRRFIPESQAGCLYWEHCYWVLNTKFAPQGGVVWASSADGRIRGWPLIQVSDLQTLEEWLRQERYIPTLTDQEKEAYGLLEQ